MMNPLRTLLIHLKGRRYRGVLKTILRYLQVKYWKYFNKTIRVSVRDRARIRLIMHPGCAVSEKLYVVGLYGQDGMATLDELMKPGALVYAFEGHPETTKRCQENFRLNGIDPAQAFAMAVADFNGSVSFSDVIGSSVNLIVDNAKAEERFNQKGI